MPALPGRREGWNTLQETTDVELTFPESQTEIRAGSTQCAYRMGCGETISFCSSAEFVGGLWFGESSKRVKQGDFHGFKGSKAEGSSGNYSYLVVETLDSAA